MILFLKLAWREIRSSRARFLFLFACVALGVGAIVAVDLFATTVEHTILGDTRALLGGDLEVSSRRSFSAKARQMLNTLPDRGIRLSAVTELSGMATPVKPEQRSGINAQLVEMKAVDQAYPLYGMIHIEPVQDIHTALGPVTEGCQDLPCFGTVVQEALLYRLQLEVGDHIRLGDAQLKIVGLLKKEPDQVAEAFRLGPRILISQEALTETQLVKPGSRIHERVRLKVPPAYPVKSLLGELRGRFSQEGVQITSFQEAQPRLRRFLDQLSLYLGLLSLTVLMVGGIGVACTIQGFLTQKTANIATMKAIGADTSQITGIYFTQCLLLGILGSVLGAGLGIGLSLMIPWLFSGLLPSGFSTTVTISPILKGFGLGISATLIFSLWPLLSIRHISPAQIYRRDVEQLESPAANLPSRRAQGLSWVQSLRQDRTRMLIGLGIIAAMASLAMVQARSVSLGLFFSGAFGSAILAILGGTGFFYWTLRKLTLPQRFLLRHSTKNLERPGNFTRAMTVAIGIGVMLMSSLMSIQFALLDFIGNQLPTKAPTFFFIDIQPDQQQPFESLVKREVPEASFTLVPVVRSRLLKIDGQPIDPEAPSRQRNRWYYTREYVLTALSSLPEDNVLTQGTWWSADDSQGSSRRATDGRTHPLVSLEEEAAKNLGLSLGSTVTLDIQGVPFTAQVASLRKVDWSSFSMNFFMIFEPGAFEGAPLTYISTARIPKAHEQSIQQAIVAAMPNVTAIHVGDVLDNLIRIFQQLATGIKSLALACVAMGAVVMMAAISINRYRRLQELAILKALGGSRMLLLGSLGVEFGCIGGFGGLVGLTLGALLSWVIVHFFFDLPWNMTIGFFTTGWWLTILATTITGLFGTYRLLGFPPLPILRQD